MATDRVGLNRPLGGINASLRSMPDDQVASEEVV